MSTIKSTDSEQQTVTELDVGSLNDLLGLNAAPAPTGLVVPAAASAKKQRLALSIMAKELPYAWQHVGNDGRCIPIPDEFWTCPTVLADREFCEKDTNIQQLLPYNILVDRQQRVFMYSRSGVGAEARLHGKLSIGPGGHVDLQPEYGQPLGELLEAEARREIKEEVGLDMTGQTIRFVGLLCDRGDDVGSVHLGLLSVNLVDDKLVAGVPEEAIDNGEWITLDRLNEPDIYNRLENWSKIAVHYLNAMKHLDVSPFAAVA